MSGRRMPDAPMFWRLGSGEAPRGPHVALVPGADAPLLPVDLPDGLRGMARERVAQRQLAEALAMPADALEMRPFSEPGQKAAWSRVLVAGSQAEGWRKQLRPGCIALVPDYLALPCIAQVWTVEVDDNGVTARLGTGDGFSAEPDMALHLLQRAPKPRAVLRLGNPEPQIDAFLETLNVPVVADMAALAKTGAGRPLRFAEAAGGIDLKTPPGAVYDRLGQGIARWRWPAIFAALALLAYVGTLTAETRRLQAETARAASLTRDLVRQHFVAQGPILDVRAQVQAIVDAAEQPVMARRDVPPMLLFQRAAPTLDRDALTLQVAEYRADTGLVTGVTADDFASLDTLVADLRGSGFLVEVLDSRAQQSGGIAARLRLQADPSQ